MAEVIVIVKRAGRVDVVWTLSDRHIGTLYNWLDWAEKQEELEEKRLLKGQEARKKRAKKEKKSS